MRIDEPRVEHHLARSPAPLRIEDIPRESVEKTIDELLPGRRLIEVGSGVVRLVRGEALSKGANSARPSALDAAGTPRM